MAPDIPVTPSDCVILPAIVPGAASVALSVDGARHGDAGLHVRAEARGVARNMAGIHWRTDYSEGVKLGEAVALSILREQRNLYKEDFGGFTITKFNGETVTV